MHLAFHPVDVLRTDEAEQRGHVYNYGFEPGEVVDGRVGPQVAEVDSFYPEFQRLIEGARSVPTLFEMSFDSVKIDTPGTVLRVGVRITPTDSAVDTMTTLNLVAAVYEDSVAYEGLSDTSYALKVERVIIGGTWGIPVQFEFGRDFDTVLATPLGAWRHDQLGVAAFIQDTASRPMAVMQSVVRRKVVR